MFQLTLRTACFAMTLWSVPSVLAVQVQFVQLDWLSEDFMPLYPNSRVGSAELSFARADASLFARDGAYVNIVTQLPFPAALPQWSVQNWFIQYGTGDVMLRSSPSVQFDLGTLSGQKVTSIIYVMTVTPGPLPQMPDLAKIQQAPVQQERYHVGGRAPLDGGPAGGSGWSTLPLTIGPFVCIPPLSLDFPISFAGTSVGGDDLRAVDEEYNGCAPAAAARSLGYMTEGLGLLPGVCQDDYEELKDGMDTEVGLETAGTTDDNMLAGKEQFTADHLLPINSELQYGMDEIGRVKNALNNGGDVEILVGWEGGGGHAAMITSVINLAGGGAIITYVDDPYQGDTTADNEEHTIVVGADGDFAGGTVDGFLVETVKNPADLNADGLVNGFDLALLLGAWGPCLNPPCGSDINGDGVTNGFDLAMLLGEWTG